MASITPTQHSQHHVYSLDESDFSQEDRTWLGFISQCFNDLVEILFGTKTDTLQHKNIKPLDAEKIAGGLFHLSNKRLSSWITTLQENLEDFTKELQTLTGKTELRADLIQKATFSVESTFPYIFGQYVKIAMDSEEFFVTESAFATMAGALYEAKEKNHGDSCSDQCLDHLQFCMPIQPKAKKTKK